MPTPTKPYTVLKTEKRSHRAKAELRQREEREKDLMTGTPLKDRKEVKNNPLAIRDLVKQYTL